MAVLRRLRGWWLYPGPIGAVRLWWARREARFWGRWGFLVWVLMLAVITDYLRPGAGDHRRKR